MAAWDPTKAKAQIRHTAYRLAQLQQRHDQTSNITKRDVATLITQGDIVTAKSKVEKLVRDDRLSALIEALEQYCNVLLERFTELGQPADFESDSPVLEAVSSIMMAAARAELKDVMILRDMLELRYGSEFTRLAVQNHGNYIPTQFIDILSKPPPSSAQVDVYMATIAKENQISWSAPLLPHQKAHALSGILDETGLPRTVDLDVLRQICSRGIPQQPKWLRPRVWKLLLGTLPPQKDSWEVEAHTKRQSYYELSRRLLASIGSLPPPTTPLSPLDASLFNLAKSLSPLPRELEEDLETSSLCPLDDSAPEGLKIETASAVDRRLYMIRRHVAGTDSNSETPEIRLNPSTDDSSSRAPQISVSSPTDSPSDGNTATKTGTLLHSSTSTRNHTSSLLRLLYIHTMLHPSTPTLYLTSLLIPLYVAMVQEIEPAELAHVEADSFWLLAELWGEVSELAQDESSHQWMGKFGQRLAWADSELWEDLHRKGLDPALPHYSYRWLAPILTRTLSLPSVLTIWDALFAQPSRTSDHNAKLEFLLDVCTSMLIHARVRLFRLGKALPGSPGLWGDVDVTVASPSPTPIEFEEGFIQGMALLQNYPMDALGGPERVLEITLGLIDRREQEVRKPMATVGLSERLRGSVWNGFMTKGPRTEIPNHQSDTESDGTPSPDWPDSGAEDEGDATETPGRALLGKFGNTVWRGITNQTSMDRPPDSPLPPATPVLPASPLQSASPVSSSSRAGMSDESSSPNPAISGAKGLGSRLGNSIWRGLTNQSAMEAPPSPTGPSIPSPSTLDSEGVASPTSSSGLWNYTEKLRDSDAAAALSKASTNWTAKATTLWRRSNPSSTVSSPEYSSHHSRQGSLNTTGGTWTEKFPKRGSLPGNYTNEYSPPQRPNFRESRYFSPDEHSAPGSPSRSIVGLPSPPDLLIKSKSALASLTGSNQGPSPKAGPRPLLLNSSSLITPSNPHRFSRSPTPVGHSPQPQRDSMSSVSSTPNSLSGARQSTYSDRDSESGSAGRFVPLRRGVSPHGPPPTRPNVTRSSARAGMPQHLAPENESEPTRGSSSSSRNVERRTSSEESARRGWSRVELPDSPSTLPSSPPPKTPTFFTNGTSVRVNGGTERQRGSLVLSESGDQASPIEKKVGRKKSWNTTASPAAGQLENTSDSSTSQEDGPRIRTKRYGRPANLRLKSDSDLRSTPSAIVEQRSPGNSVALMPESSDIVVTTPRASDFPSPGSGSPGRPSRVRKNSRSPRRPHRKADMPTKGSGGEEGDDEGYDDFLSAYESEDGAVAAAA